MESQLAVTLREARLMMGLTQAAERAGITASYLSRIESGAWERGGPWPSNHVLRALARVLNLSSTDLIAAKETARPPDQGGGRPCGWTRGNGRAPYAVSLGDRAVYDAVGRLVERTPAGGSLRVTNVLALNRPRQPHQCWHVEQLRSLGRRLAQDPEVMLYCVATSNLRNFDLVRCSTEQLAGGREPEAIGNIRSRFAFGNPLVLDVIIGENEALIAVPDRRGHPYFRAAVAIDDPDFVAALRAWFDEFVWDPPCAHADVNYDRLGESLEAIRSASALERDRGAGEPAPRMCACGEA